MLVPKCQFLIYFFPEKEPAFLEEITDSKYRAGNMENYLKYVIVPESNKVLKTSKLMYNNKLISKGLENQMKVFSMVKAEKI